MSASSTPSPDVAIGIDLGGTNLRLAGVRRNAEVLLPIRIPTSRFTSTQDLISGISEQIRALDNQLRQQNEKVIGVGIGVPGGVSSDGDVVYFSPNYPEWKNLPLRRLLSEQTGLKIRAENDANTWAYGEGWIGAGRDVKHFVLLTMGTGVGSGIVMNGHVYRGHSGIAGEIGHTTIEPDGHPCECGGCGCLETIASAKGIVRIARELLASGGRGALAGKDPSRLTPEQVSEAAFSGDPLSLEVMERVGRALGIGIVNIINTLNPEIIILGGGVSAARELFTPAMNGEIRRRAFSEIGKRTPILPPLLGENSGILGAARLILEE